MSEEIKDETQQNGSEDPSSPKNTDVDKILNTYSTSEYFKKTEEEKTNSAKQEFMKKVKTIDQNGYKYSYIDSYYNFYNVMTPKVDIWFKNTNKNWVDLSTIGNNKKNYNNNFFVSAVVTDNGARKITLELFDRTYYTIQQLIFNAIKATGASTGVGEVLDSNNSQTVNLKDETGKKAAELNFKVSNNLIENNLKIRWGYTDDNPNKSETKSRTNSRYFFFKNFEDEDESTSTHRWNDALSNKSVIYANSDKDKKNPIATGGYDNIVTHKNQTSIISQSEEFFITDVKTNLTETGMRYTITAVGSDSFILNSYKFVQMYASLRGTTKDLMAYFMNTFNEYEDSLIRVCWNDSKPILNGTEYVKDYFTGQYKSRTEKNEEEDIEKITEKKDVLLKRRGLLSNTLACFKKNDGNTISSDCFNGCNISYIDLMKHDDSYGGHNLEAEVNTPIDLIQATIEENKYLFNGNIDNTAVLTKKIAYELPYNNKPKSIKKTIHGDINEEQIEYAVGNNINIKDFKEKAIDENIPTKMYGYQMKKIYLSAIYASGSDIKNTDKVSVIKRDNKIDNYYKYVESNSPDEVSELKKIKNILNSIYNNIDSENAYRDCIDKNSSFKNDFSIFHKINNTSEAANILNKIKTEVIDKELKNIYAELNNKDLSETVEYKNCMDEFNKINNIITNYDDLLSRENAIKYSLIKQRSLATQMEDRNKNVGSVSKDGGYSKMISYADNEVGNTAIEYTSLILKQLNSATSSILDYIELTPNFLPYMRHFFKAFEDISKKSVNDWNSYENLYENVKDIDFGNENFLIDKNNIYDDKDSHVSISEGKNWKLIDIKKRITNTASLMRCIYIMTKDYKDADDDIEIYKKKCKAFLDDLINKKIWEFTPNTVDKFGAGTLKKVYNKSAKYISEIITEQCIPYTTPSSLMTSGYCIGFWINIDSEFTNNVDIEFCHDFNGYLNEKNAFGSNGKDAREPGRKGKEEGGYYLIKENIENLISSCKELKEIACGDKESPSDAPSNMELINNTICNNIKNREVEIVPKYDYVKYKEDLNKIQKIFNNLSTENTGISSSEEKDLEEEIQAIDKEIPEVEKEIQKIKDQYANDGIICIALGGEESKSNYLEGKPVSSPRYYKSLTSLFNSYVNQCPPYTNYSDVNNNKDNDVQKYETVDETGTTISVTNEQVNSVRKMTWSIVGYEKEGKEEGKQVPIIGFHYMRPNVPSKIRWYSWGTGNPNSHCVKKVNIETASEFGMLNSAIIKNVANGNTSSVDSNGFTQKASDYFINNAFVNSIITDDGDADKLCGAMVNGVKKGTIEVLGDPSLRFQGEIQPATYPIYLDIKLQSPDSWYENVDGTLTRIGSAGIPCQLSGYYVVTNITHNISESGYTTVLEVMSYPSLKDEIAKLN